MFYKKLWFYLYAPFFLLMLSALIAFNVYSSYAYHEFSIKQVQVKLKNQADLFQNTLALVSDDHFQIQLLCKKSGAKTGTRFTVIKADGVVIGDSVESPEAMNNHGDRLEILALKEGKKSSVKIRHSETLDKKMMYYSQYYLSDSGDVLYVRTSLSLEHIDENINEILSKVLFGGVLVFLVSSIIIYYITNRVVSKVNEFKVGAEGYAQGNFTQRISPPEILEFADLTNSMNLMADSLDGKIRLIEEQHHRLDTILSSLAEGVIAVDVQEQIISFNETFVQLLDISKIETGMPIHEVLRNADFIEFISMVLFHEGAQEKQIQFFNGSVMNVIVKGTQLKDAMGEKMGAVIIVSDISKLKQLEQVRQDFVANVSHEIKTPITSIKGFVETLRDGALEDKEVAARFVNIMGRQVDRLITIIEDLLILSQLDRDNGSLEDCALHEVDSLFKMVQSACSEKATLKNIELNFKFDPTLKVNFNFNLMEQALRNLVENALRYSENGKKIEVNCQLSGKEAVFSVKDEGVGIPKEHHDRIFERFYRVDKARSRKMGSTGLGLSIVNQIAQAHGGYPSVDSQLGVGSTFKIHILKR